DVDPLAEGDLEAPMADLLDARLPLLARLAEEVVVEQDDALGVRRAPPDLGDGGDVPGLAFLLWNHAEAAAQPTPPLREAERRREVGVERVVGRELVPVDRRVDLGQARLDRDAGAAPLDETPLALDGLAGLVGKREDRGTVAVAHRIEERATSARPDEGDVVTARAEIR